MAAKLQFRRIHLVLLLAAAFFIEIFFIYSFSSTDNRVSDLFVKHVAGKLSADPDIVIIDIDEASLAAMAKHEGNWPWPRAVHGELVEQLLTQQPRAIVFDILFTDPDILQPDSDRYFIDVVRQSDNIFFPVQVLRTTADVDWPRHAKRYGFTTYPQKERLAQQQNTALLLPLKPIAELGRNGSINFLPDPDGIGRRYLVYMTAHGWRIPSLPTRVATALNYSIPQQKSIRLHWRGDRFAHRRVSFYDLYQDFNSSQPQRPTNEFTNKIVLIGTTASGLHDLRPTPVHNQHPGTEILATAIDNLKNNRFMDELPPPVTLIVTVMLLLLVYAMFTRLQPLIIAGLLMLLTLGYLGVVYLLVNQGYILAPFTPLAAAWLFYVAAALYEYLQEKRSREKAVRMFSRFLDERVVTELVSTDTTGILNSQTRNITVLFSDIRGFTRLSENRDASEILAILNRYYRQQVQVIFRHGGTLDKFIGDAIMAFWGAPVDDPQHACHAIQAALEMQHNLASLRQELGVDDSFDIGIGIHSGEAVVGMVGFEERMDYTCIGDTVNLASRIEGQTRNIARILVSRETRDQCRDQFDFINHGSYKVKGREQMVQLYEPRRRSR